MGLVIAALVGFIGLYSYHSIQSTNKTYSQANKTASAKPAATTVSTASYGFVQNIDAAPASARSVIAAALRPSYNACQAFFQKTSLTNPLQPTYAVAKVTATTISARASCNDGGFVVLFGQTNGRWLKIWQGNGTIDCTLIEKYKVSASAINNQNCVSANGKVESIAYP